jgi:peptidyl-prolyl cis-trans isomerase D
MISAFRNFFKSKFGLAITFGFLALIALAFAASDITGTGFGGVSGGDRVAVVGDDRVSTNELDTSTRSALVQVQQQNPTITMEQFVEEGLLEEVLTQLIDRYAIGAYAEKYGLRAGDNLVNSEILTIPAFRGVSGEFDQQTYLAALQRQGISDADLRRDLSDGLLAQQLLVPAFAAPQMPAKIARQYAALVTERRKGTIAFIPSAEFAPESGPTSAQLTKFYNDNKSRYVRPERRTVRYAAFSIENVKDKVTVSPSEIKKRYEAEPKRFAASETRSLTSFLVPTKEGADAIVARIRGGVAFETAAREAGFNVSSVKDQTREQISSSYSNAVATEVFKTQRGAVATPARSSLGFYIARVDDITSTPARTLAQATDELREQILTEKTAAALSDLSATIEDELDDGSALVEVANRYNLDVVTSAPLLPDGRVFGDPKAQVPEALRPTLSTAFQMEEGKPQIAPLVPGERYVIFDVQNIEEAAAPPLSQIRERVAAAWRLSEGSKKAKAVANNVMKALRGGKTPQAALAAQKGNFPPPDAIDLGRQELIEQSRGNLPPPLVLMFSMAEGSVKMLQAPNDDGWFIIDLDAIETTMPKADDPVLANTRQQLAPALVNEYTDQLTLAIREDIGVERNEPAIEAVRKRLLGN